MTAYPEHEKLKAIGGANQTVGDFIEWLGQNGYTICVAASRQWRFEVGGEYMPTRTSRDQFIASFFGIDAKKLNDEKDQMVADLQQARADLR